MSVVSQSYKSRKKMVESSRKKLQRDLDRIEKNVKREVAELRNLAKGI